MRDYVLYDNGSSWMHTSTASRVNWVNHCDCYINASIQWVVSIASRGLISHVIKEWVYEMLQCVIILYLIYSHAALVRS